MKTFLAVVAVSFAVASSVVIADTREPTLYERLGGEPVVTRVVEQTIRRLADDPTVNRSLEGVNVKKLDAKIVLQICALADGGCRYDGDDMKLAHEGMNIGQREFYAMVEALRIALDDNGVGDREKNELLRLLAPMKRDVVSR